jgi:hypothetical protein
MKKIMSRFKNSPLWSQTQNFFEHFLRRVLPHLTGAFFADTLIAAVSLPLAFFLRLGI